MLDEQGNEEITVVNGTLAPEFKEFPKIPRWSREIVITEKLDGTNGVIHFEPDGKMWVGSRSRWLTPGKTTDNHGFARWAYENEDDLRSLGPGSHHGEWWGLGIQRGYGLPHKAFSLFAVHRWSDEALAAALLGDRPSTAPVHRPKCCGVVPVLYSGPNDTGVIHDALYKLSAFGSIASPGFTNPEGIVIYHTASKQLYKKTLEKDEAPKGAR